MKRLAYSLSVFVGLTIAPNIWAQDLTILNARIAVGDGPVIERGYISIQQGKIVAVGPSRPAELTGSVLDAHGMTAIPGLVDGHKHINTGPYEKEQMADMIENGFTTVLSGGGPADGNQKLIQHIDSGQINGPQVLASGRITGFNLSLDQGRAFIRDLAAQGVRFTGEMPTTPVPSATPQELELLRAMVDEGKKAGVEIMVHAVSTPAMVASTQAGVRHQVHLPNKDFMSYDDAAYIAGTGTIVLDLVSFGAPIIDVFQKDDVARFRTGLRWPESIAGANRDEKGRAVGTEGAYTLINARRLWDASHGKGLGFGSDQSYAVREVLEHELKSLMVMFSVQDVIRIMTINTATFLNMQNEIGTIEPRKRANIVLLQGNPFEDFNDLLKTAVVLKDGKVVVDKRANKEPPAADGDPAIAGTPVGTLTAATARPDQLPVMSCQTLGGLRLAQARVQSAKDVPAGSIQIPESNAYDQQAHQLPVPPRCEIDVHVHAAKGVGGHVAAWLPSVGWNARLLVLGGASADSTSMTDALAQGYAVVSAASAPPHDVAVAAKALTSAYYGGSPRYAYWQQTSAEVGSALLAVQGNPSDFDGLIVGAPAGAAGVGNASSLKLSGFAARGGKIIEYHGGAAEPAPADQATAAYDGQVMRSGGVEQARSFYRLFLVPAGQKGDTYQGDWVVALDEWVQRDRAPDKVLLVHSPSASAGPPPKPAGVVFQPPFGVHSVCAYPQVAQTTGPGTETPVDYICVSASRAAAVSGARP